MTNDFEILIPDEFSSGVKKIGEINHEVLISSLDYYIKTLRENKPHADLKLKMGTTPQHLIRIEGQIEKEEQSYRNIDQNSYSSWAKYTDEVQKIAEEFNIPKQGRVRLFMLLPERVWYMHSDNDLYRVHIPLLTNDKSFMVVDNRLWRLDVGSVYLVKVGELHTAFNAGRTNRIHLIFDNCKSLYARNSST